MIIYSWFLKAERTAQVVLVLVPSCNCNEKRFCKALCCEKRYINVRIQYNKSASIRAYLKKDLQLHKTW